MKNGPYELIVAPAEYPGKKYRGRYAYQHRVVYWQTHGELPPIVHHDNEEKRDNSPSNLAGKTREAHTAEHNAERTPKVVVTCGWCGCSFELVPCKVRSRLKTSRSGLLFCCRSHGGLSQWSKK
jgi:HNH endonuclease